MTTRWQRLPLGIGWREIDERLGDADAPTLLSVSMSRGVVPRSETSDRVARADSFAAYKRCKSGDLVLNRFNAYRGALGVAQVSGIVSPDYLVLRPHGFESRFLDALLRSHPVSEHMKMTMGGMGANDPDASAFARIDKAALASLRVPIPPLYEQRAIADYLDRETARIDALVGKQERLIQTLRERRAAVVERTTLAGEAPAVALKQVASVVLGKMLDSGRQVRAGETLRPYVRAADVLHGGDVNLTDLNSMHFSQEEDHRLDLRRHDVLVIEGGATVGKPGLLRQDVPGVRFQKTINRVRVRAGAADGRYLFWSLKALYERGHFTKAYDTVSFLHLTAEKLREIRLPLPSLDEQRRLADYLDEKTAQIDALIEKVERFIEVSKERRAALITAAVTGEIEVREHPTSSVEQTGVA